MRLVAILLALCLGGAGCGGQSGDATKHSHWYRLGYVRCAKAFGLKSFPSRHVGPGTMLVPPHHLKDFIAGCRAQSLEIDIAYHVRYGWLEPYL